jgi:hypothetical protein
MKLLRARRGRPQKFGRPAKAVTLTLPEDVIGALTGIDEDLGRAVVRVSQPLAAKASQRGPAELSTYGDSAVIVVKPLGVLARMAGVTLVPMPDGRALISLDPSMTVHEFELMLRDVLESNPRIDPDARTLLVAIADILKTARQTKNVTIRQRSIIVLQDSRSRRRAG